MGARSHTVGKIQDGDDLDTNLARRRRMTWPLTIKRSKSNSEVGRIPIWRLRNRYHVTQNLFPVTI